MKHTLKKSLVVLLATLMLLGAMATDSAAEANAAKASTRPAALAEKPILSTAQSGHVKAASSEFERGTLTVTEPGTAEVTLRMGEYGNYYMAKYDLSGLVFVASGSELAAPLTIAYDDIKNGDLQDFGFRWDASVSYLDWENQPDGWVLGPNQAYLEVYAYQCADFRVTKTVGGVEYGTFDSYQDVFYGAVPITVNGVAAPAEGALDVASAVELPLGQPKPVSVPERARSGYNGYYNRDTERKLFKFTPAESGKYYLHSNGASNGEELYDWDGVNHSTFGVDPWVELFNAAGSLLKENDDHGNEDSHRYNFGLFVTLEAGETYYLQTSAFYGGDYTVQADVNPNKLVAPQKEVTIKMGEYISMETLLAGTTWSNSELGVYCDGYVLEHDYLWDYWGYEFEVGYTAYRVGSETLYIYAPDGEEVQIKVTVKHSFLSWVRHYLLNGWLFELTGVERPDGAVGDIAGGLLYVIFLFGFVIAIPLVPLFMIVGLFRK